MSLRRASVLLAVFGVPVVLVLSIAFTWTQSDATAASAALTALLPTPAITPVTPIPASLSPSSSGDTVNDTGEYVVIGAVLGIMAIVVAGFVVLWFVVD